MKRFIQISWLVCAFFLVIMLASPALATSSLANSEPPNTALTNSALTNKVLTNSVNSQWDSRVVRGSLENGLNYALYDSKKSTDPFNIRLIVHAGAIDENPNQIGVAHMLEHMVFYKTKEHPETVFSYLNHIGWKTGLQINAKTMDTETHYMIRTRPDDKLNLDQSLELLADMASNAQLSEDNWKVEQQVILEEWRQGHTAASRINRMKKAVTRNGSHYAHRSPIGNENSISNMPLSELIAFYQTWYVASNMSLIVSGNLSIEQTKGLINKHFGKLASKPKPEHKNRALPITDQLYIAKIQDPEGSTSRTVFGFRFEMDTGFNPDETTSLYDQSTQLRIENYILRKLIGKQFRRQNHLSNQTDIRLSAVLKDSTQNQFTLAFSRSNEANNEALKSLLMNMARLKKYGLDIDDLSTIKESIKQILNRNINAVAQRDYAKWEDKITEAILTNKPLMSPEQQQKDVLTILDKITLNKLNERLTAFMNAKDRFIYYQAKKSIDLDLPSETEVVNWQTEIADLPLEPLLSSRDEGLQNNELKKFTDNIEYQTSENQDLPDPIRSNNEPSAESEKLTYLFDSKHSVHQWQLNNGDRVIWLERPTENDHLFIRSISDSGYKNRQFSSWLSQAAIQLAEQSGFDNFSLSDLQQWRKQNKIQWKWKHSPSQLDLATSVKPEALSKAFHLYYLINQHPQIENDALSDTKADLVALREDLVETKVQNSRKIIFDIHQKLDIDSIDIPEKHAIDSLTLDQLNAAAVSHFSNKADMFIVGQFDKDKLENLIHDYLVPITRENKISMMDRATQGSTRSEPGLMKQVYELHNPVDYEKSTYYAYQLKDYPWSPEKAFLVTTLNPLLQTALKQKLRREMGGIYSLEFELSLSPDNQQLRSRTKFMTAPEKVAALSKETETILKNYQLVLDTNKLMNIREDIRQAEANRLQYANTWLHRLILSYRAYDNARYLSHMYKMDQLVTKEALGKVLDTSRSFDKGMIAIINSRPSH